MKPAPTYDDAERDDAGWYRVKVQVRREIGPAEPTFLWGGRGIIAAPTLTPTFLTVRVDQFGETIQFGTLHRTDTAPGVGFSSLGTLAAGEAFTFPLHGGAIVGVFARCVNADGTINPNIDTYVWCCLHVLERGA